MSEHEKSNFNEIIRKIMKKSLFTERQIEIILKQKDVLRVEFGCSKGAYFRQVAQSRRKLEGLYYSIILLEAYDVIFPNDNDVTRLVDVISRLKDLESVPANQEQIMSTIETAVRKMAVL
tara:strand:+ start:748 stop:1107 length:360 start_codon:yes stop_codon:yes gene_type:complete